MFHCAGLCIVCVEMCTVLLPPGVYIYIYIQSVSRLEDITAGGDFLGLCDQKSSYNMCRFLDGYGVMGIFNSRTRPRVNRVSRNQLAGDVLSLVGLSFALSALFAPADSRSSQPSGSLCCGRRWHFRKPALSTDQFKLKAISRS